MNKLEKLEKLLEKEIDKVDDIICLYSKDLHETNTKLMDTDKGYRQKKLKLWAKYTKDITEGQDKARQMLAVIKNINGKED